MSPTLTSIQGFFQKQCYALLHQLAMDLFLPTPITPPDKRRASKKKKKKTTNFGLAKRRVVTQSPWQTCAHPWQSLGSSWCLLESK